MSNKSIGEMVSEKISAAKAKIAKKCGRSVKSAAVLFAVAFGCVLAGCSTADAPTAQRAQSITAKDITINLNIHSSCAPSNTTAVSPSIHLEIATAAQANETAGAETMTSTATQTPTTDVKPQTTLTYGLCSGSASGTSWIEDLTNASAKGLSAWLKSGTANGTMTVTKTDGSTETVTCKDGLCTTASGECINCTP